MKTITKGIIILLGSALALPASAGLITRAFTGENDCSGYFGQGFDSCQIFVNDNDQRIEISPVIAKYDISDSGAAESPEINSDFDSFDGSEISFTPGSSGTWTYTPGADDPGIRYWVAKAGNGFNLFWYVDDAEEAVNCSGDAYNLACLNLAQSVTSGDWATPEGKDLSHLTFYDSKPPAYVPEPGSLTLLGLGLFGLGVVRRKVKKDKIIA